MKRIIASFMSIILIFSPFIQSSVKAAPTQQNELNVVQSLKQLEEKYDLSLISEEQIPKGERLKFNTIEEFESFINYIKSEQTLSLDASALRTSYSLDDTCITPNNYAGSDYGYGVHTINWWAPWTGWGWTGIACWKNISFSYSWEKVYSNYAKFTQFSGINSYLSGINIAISWNQTSFYPTSVPNGNASSISVSGYYLLGVEIGGVPIGAKINDTWNKEVALIYNIDKKTFVIEDN